MAQAQVMEERKMLGEVQMAQAQLMKSKALEPFSFLKSLGLDLQNHLHSQNCKSKMLRNKKWFRAQVPKLLHIKI